MGENDRELLELAAKAAGINAKWYDFTGCMMRTCSGQGLTRWEPHIDDGDSRRLQVACGLSVEPYPYYSFQKHSVIVKQRRRSDQMREANPTEVTEVYGDDPYAATRRAIVRAAAEIGKEMT